MCLSYRPENQIIKRYCLKYLKHTHDVFEFRVATRPFTVPYYICGKIITSKGLYYICGQKLLLADPITFVEVFTFRGPDTERHV